MSVLGYSLPYQRIERRCEFDSREATRGVEGVAVAVAVRHLIVQPEGVIVFFAEMHARSDQGHAGRAAGGRERSAVAVDARFDALLTAVDEWSLALTSGLAANRSKSGSRDKPIDVPAWITVLKIECDDRADQIQDDSQSDATPRRCSQRKPHNTPAIKNGESGCRRGHK